MKTIAMLLPDVEAAMLVEVQRINKECRNLDKLLAKINMGECEKILW